MLAEHRDLVALLQAIRESTGPVRAAAAAQALRSLFDSHLVKENEQILPLLAQSGEVSLADILAGMHELLGGESPDARAEITPQRRCAGECSCGAQDPAGALPELDARAVPHAIRYATIFGALDSVEAGGGMVLVAPHDPLALLAARAALTGTFHRRLPRARPEAWRIRFIRP